MIKSFRHKGLLTFFLTGSKKGVIPSHARKLSMILDRLNTSTGPKDMSAPIFGLHELIGQRKGTWAVEVNGNWRVTFEFENANAINVNYEDYH